MRFHTALFALTFTSLSVIAQYPDLDAIAMSVARNNSQHTIDSLRNSSDIMQQRAENNLSDPEIEFSHLWGNSGAGNKLGVQISQSFDWPGAYAARSRAITHNTRSLDLLAMVNRSDLLLRIKQTLIETIYAHQLQRLYAEALDEIDSLAAIVQRNVEKKEISVLDGNKLKIERISMSRKFNDAASSVASASEKLRELNGGKAVTDLMESLLDYPASTSLRPIQAYLDENRRLNPQIAYNRSLAGAAAADIKALKAEALPGFSVGVRHELEDGDRFNGFSVSMTLPFLSSRHKRKSAELNRKVVELSASQTDIADESRIMTDYNSALTLSKEIAQYDSVLADGENLQLLRKAFEMRYISLTDYISDYIYFTDAKADYLALLYNYHLQLASLERYDWLAGNATN